MSTKQLRFLNLLTKGNAEFTVKVYVDNLYKDVDGEIIFDPAASIILIGNEAPGFGYDAGPYGGGRRSNDPRLQGFPVRFKSIKFVIEGSTREPLRIVALLALSARSTTGRKR